MQVDYTAQTKNTLASEQAKKLVDPGIIVESSLGGGIFYQDSTRRARALFVHERSTKEESVVSSSIRYYGQYLLRLRC